MDCAGSTLLALAIGSIIAWTVNWWTSPPKSDWQRALPVHEGCSCDEELRQLLRANADLEWHRLFLIAAAFLLASLLLIAGVLSIAALGCCWPCACLAGLRARPRGVIASRGQRERKTEEAQSNLLAILAANEVRR